MSVDNLELILRENNGRRERVVGTLPSRTGDYNLDDGTPVSLTVEPYKCGGVMVKASTIENDGLDFKNKPYLKSLIAGIEGVLVMGNVIQARVSQTKSVVIHRKKSGFLKS